LRLGGPNFHQIPINAPIAQAHNNQRDGIHQQAIHRGRVAYEPNSLAGGCPFQAGGAGFRSFPQAMEGDKVRGKPEKFAEHFAQATLFFNSQTDYEKAHIVRGFRFELTKLTVPAIRERVVSMLRNVSEDLARQVADGIGISLPKADAAAREGTEGRGAVLAPLSLTARPGDGSVRGMNVAILIAPGVTARSIESARKPLVTAGRSCAWSARDWATWTASRPRRRWRRCPRCSSTRW
jgi:catalase